MHFTLCMCLAVFVLAEFGNARKSKGYLESLNSTNAVPLQMPALYQLDDYDLCLEKKPSSSLLLAHSTYCMVYVEIVPNASSVLWQHIANISLDQKHNFRHDRLFRGVCLERCKIAMHTLSRFQQQQLYEGKVMDMELSNYYDKVHRRASDERIRYTHLINSCLNREFDRLHQLRVWSSIEYCERADEPLTHDALDCTIYVLLAIIMLLTVISSLYDCRLRLQQSAGSSNARSNLFYQQQLSTRAQRLFCAFSICRNYYRLLLPSKHGDYDHDLRFFDAFRVMGVFAVILGHTLMMYLTVPIRNPEFFERYLYKFESSIFQNGSVVIQIFFLMSGFLLYLNFTKRQLISKNTGILRCIRIYFKVFLSRYFRLLPSLVFIILFSGTILTRLGDGPFWRHLTELERTFCRQNWWKNIFFINNYMLKESCAQQTWYLAADMQLFEVFLIVIIVTTRYPQVKRFIYILLLLLAYAIPAFLTYFLKLNAVYHLQPETYRYLYFRDSETFYRTYLPFYTNLSGYLMGFLCAQFYLKIKSSATERHYQGKWKFELGMLLLIPAALLVLFSGYIFIKYDFDKPSIWLALYAGMYKNLWVLICSGLVCCMCLKMGWLGYELCSLSLFRPLARISFQAFLWHVTVLRLITGYFREPIYINHLYLFGNVLLVFVLTLIVAFLVALLFEYPLAELLKLAIMHEKANAKTTRGNSAESQIECLNLS